MSFNWRKGSLEREPLKGSVARGSLMDDSLILVVRIAATREKRKLDGRETDLETIVALLGVQPNSNHIPAINITNDNYVFRRLRR